MEQHTSAELKRISRGNLTGHWGLAIGSELLSGLIVSALLMPFYILFLVSRAGMIQGIIYVAAALIIATISVIMEAGISRIYLCFARNQETGLGMMFGEFTRRPGRYILGSLIMMGIEFLCMLPGSICMIVGVAGSMVSDGMIFLTALIGTVLFIGGTIVFIVLAFRYSLVFILCVEHSDMGIIEAFHESALLMDGNKGKLFYIYLSFIGWSILGMLSCGVGMLWITSYMNQTILTFYRDVIGELR